MKQWYALYVSLYSYVPSTRRLKLMCAAVEFNCVWIFTIQVLYVFCVDHNITRLLLPDLTDIFVISNGLVRSSSYYCTEASSISVQNKVLNLIQLRTIHHESHILRYHYPENFLANYCDIRQLTVYISIRNLYMIVKKKEPHPSHW